MHTHTQHSTKVRATHHLTAACVYALIFIRRIASSITTKLFPTLSIIQFVSEPSFARSIFFSLLLIFVLVDRERIVCVFSSRKLKNEFNAAVR